MSQTPSPSALLLSSGLPTVGQLERQLSQALRSSYSQWLGHSPGNVLCHIAGRVINVVIQDSITPVEELLGESQARLARNGIHDRIRRPVSELVSRICGVAPNSVMLDSNPDSGCTGIIVLLTADPKVRARKRRP